MATASPIRLGIVGIGKIARDQHLPAIAADPSFDLVAAASHAGEVAGIANFRSIEAMLSTGLELDAVALCTPPLGRHRLAATALTAGLHVLLEKPPGATLGEVADLTALADAQRRTLFASWHSREAAAVGPAESWLAGRSVRSVRIIWKEDVRVWHPGQDWIFAAGGLGVFDPAINALSIVTKILPEQLLLDSAELEFPANRDAPIAATLKMRHGDAVVSVDLDFLQTGPQRWDIMIGTDSGTLSLSHGGSRMAIDGDEVSTGDHREYPMLYKRFAELIARGESDVDVTPLQIAADAFLIGKRRIVAPFDF
ncbi:gfo/Idh/MocA family oxidoreductase [Sphingomonas koreensis]|nr:gfo/Idh/MocA family oxidoreductase [Sphingomonas koreensis]